MIDNAEAKKKKKKGSTLPTRRKKNLAKGVKNSAGADFKQERGRRARRGKKRKASLLSNLEEGGKGLTPWQLGQRCPPLLSRRKRKDGGGIASPSRITPQEGRKKGIGRKGRGGKKNSSGRIPQRRRKCPCFLPPHRDGEGPPDTTSRPWRGGEDT